MFRFGSWCYHGFVDMPPPPPPPPSPPKKNMSPAAQRAWGPAAGAGDAEAAKATAAAAAAQHPSARPGSTGPVTAVRDGDFNKLVPWVQKQQGRLAYCCAADRFPRRAYPRFACPMAELARLVPLVKVRHSSCTITH